MGILKNLKKETIKTKKYIEVKKLIVGDDFHTLHYLSVFGDQETKLVVLKKIEKESIVGNSFQRVRGTENIERCKQIFPNASIENEAKNGLKNNKYSIAMARTMAPHSASSQFFINVADNQFLDFPGQDGWGYCVFGEVVAGQDVVDTIQSVETLNLGGHADVPASPIIITKAFIQD